MEKTDASRPRLSKKSQAMPQATAATNFKSVSLVYFAPKTNTVAVAGDFYSWDVQAHMLKKKPCRLPRDRRFVTRAPGAG